MNLFILNNNNHHTSVNDVTTFINYWKGKYYSYTNVSDTVYHYSRDSLMNNTDIERAVSLIGAWKTNSISCHLQTNNLAFNCPCGRHYYYTGMWKSGTSSAYDIWSSLPNNLTNHKALLLQNPKQLINDLQNLRYNGPTSPKTRFGLIYSITYLHFLDSLKYPIFDIFVFRAVNYVFSTTRPQIPYIISNDIKDFDRYIKDFVTNFNLLKNNTNSTSRDLDKALWAFGHYVSDSKKIKKNKKVCCEK